MKSLKRKQMLILTSLCCLAVITSGQDVEYEGDYASVDQYDQNDFDLVEPPQDPPDYDPNQFLTGNDPFSRRNQFDGSFRRTTEDPFARRPPPPVSFDATSFDEESGQDRNRFTTTTRSPFRRLPEPETVATTRRSFVQETPGTTEDPFRRPPPVSTPTTELNFNQFQNNELGSNIQPINPFPQNRNRNRPRPQVDEFGNPLGEIYNVDTTRFELGSGIESQELKCPRNWVRFRASCYKFTRSPIKRWDDARTICQAYRHQDQDSSDLASVDTLEEHRFIAGHLNLIDPQHRRWYISTRQEDQNRWVNVGDQSQMINLQEYFLSSNEWGESAGRDYKKDYLTYAYSLNEGRWGFQPVFGHEEYLYICEMPIEEVTYLMTDERTHEYGNPIGDPRYYPSGPYFIREPNNTVFNQASRQIKNDIALRCIATGWPTPTYRWYRELYRNDSLIEKEVDPLADTRITISGGQLIIHAPNQVTDRGRYFCKATNKFGTIRSQSASISFGFIGEFILRRNNEVGHENWGKAISCDPPQYFPDVKFYWARDYFPNFVEEDRRVMVSYDGYIYFSSLEKIDQVWT